MEKPLYILIFLLLWSTRIRGVEQEDINGTLSPSTQKNRVRNSPTFDKASTSPITKTTAIFDPNPGTAEPFVPNSITSKSARDSPEALSPDSVAPKLARESAEIESPPNKSKAPQTNTDSTTANTTTLSDPNSESLETISASNNSEDPEAETESSNTESAPTKPEAPDTKNGTQQPFFRNFVTSEPTEDNPIINFETHGPSKESLETDSASIKSEAPETEIESSETDSPPIKSKATENKPDMPEIESTQVNLRTRRTTHDMPEIKSTPVKLRTPRTTYVTSMEPREPSTIMTNNSTPTVTKDPNCTDIKNIQFVNQTATSFTLDFNNLPEKTREYLCVKELYKQNNANCTPIEHTTMELSPLNASTVYTISVFSYVSNSKMNQLLSTNSCQIIGYTAPKNPNCTDIKTIRFVNQTATHLTLDFNNLSETAREHLCVKELYKQDNTNCTPIEHTTMKFGALNASTEYQFSVFSYVSTKTMKHLLSTNSCQIIGYTGPADPNCALVSITNKTATSLLLSLKDKKLIGDIGYIAELFQGPDLERKTILNMSNNFLQNVTNLTAGTAYTFTIFTINHQAIKSVNSCQLKEEYTLPSNPKCEDVQEIVLVSNRNKASITLSLINISESNRKQLCIKREQNQNDNACKPAEHNVMFENLTPSTLYNFSLFSYIKVLGNETFFSDSGCPFSKYTCPSDPNCTSILISNKTTDGMVLDLQNLHTRGAASYISEIFNGGNLLQTLTTPSNRSLQNIRNLIAGTSYTLKIYAVSPQNIKSANNCKIEVYTYPNPPMRPAKGDVVVKGKTYLVIKWDPPSGGVDRYNITIHCNCSCTPNYTDLVIKTETEVNVTQLQSGTHCSFLITAISGGLLSTPLEYQNIETTETVPGEVSEVNVTNITSTDITITWGRPVELNGDLRNYSVIISNETFNKREQVLTTNMSFTNLNPGLCYNINIAAVNDAGRGKEKSTTVYTKEQIPSEVSDMELTNTSSTSISVMWSKPLYPNGVITQYMILVKKVQSNNTRRIYLSCVDCHRPCPTAKSFNKIEKTEAGVMKNDVKFSKSNQTMHYEITELDIFAEYSITVNAFTAAGLGKGKNGKMTTSEDKPSTPGQPVINKVQIDSVSFSFKKPENENGVITNQEIEYTFIPYNVCSTDEFIKEQTETIMPAVKMNTVNKQFSASLENLTSYWNYTIRVRVSTYAGFSSYSNKTIIQTLPTTPSKVTNITAAQTFSRRIELTWIQPCHPNGIIINYRIDVTNINNSNTEVRYSNITSFSVTGLLPYRLYQFKVYTQVRNVSELSEPTNSTKFLTGTEAPFRPRNITVTPNVNSVNLSWEAPEEETGPTRYMVIAIDKDTSTLTGTCQTQGFNNTSCRIDGLDSYWNYSLTVQAIVGNFTPNESKTDVQTKESAPGKVSYFTVTQDANITAKTNVHIEWSPPTDRDLNGILKKYFLQYWYQTNQIMIKSYDSTTTKAKVFVKAEKTYTFQIFAKTNEKAADADYVTKILPIKPGAPLPLPKQKVPLINKGPRASDDQTQIAVAFSQTALCNDSNGEIKQWYIIVSKTPRIEVFRGARTNYSEFIEKTYKKWGDVYEKDVNIPYIASDSWNPHCESGSRRKRSAPRETISYTLGSDGECESGNRKYCNGKLEPGQTYRVRYAVCTAGGCLESEFSEPFQTAPNNVPAIAGSLTAVVIALAVVIVVIIILKKRGKGPFKSLDNGEVGQQNEAFTGVEMKGTSKPKAVKIADFAYYVQKLHADSNLLFSSEYKLLKETCPTHTTKAAEVQVNRIKNRYTNILSYDHSRVKLLPTEDDEGSDYINANYMPGYTSPREYIATQGPLPFTRDDFWRMIWEQNVSIIVMLTQLVERGRRKCDIYWPEASREPVYYGDLVVELESESTLPDYVLRVMSIKLGNRVRKVKQLHYLKWPDMGCPETTWLLLNFVGATRLYLPHTDPGPIVVHCSAGVGRTGTFIAVDYLMQHVRTSDVIDIYSYVMKMRNNRPNMVQTEDQYVFIHDCIKDYVNKNDDDTDDEEEEEEKQEDQSIYMNV